MFISSDEGYAAACQGFNLALTKQPALVEMAVSTGDVVDAVKYAAAAGLSVSVQATGHGGGAPLSDGLLINTSGMRSMAIDPVARTARVEAGVRWGTVIDAAVPYGLAPLNGSSPDVGVVGFTLGGGMGPMGRTFSLSADHVRKLQLVIADGTVVEVDTEHQPDLFWALRGGKCSVGIVTEIEFDLMPVADFFGVGIFYPASAASTVLHAFGRWAPALPEEASTSIALLRLPDSEDVPPPLRGTFAVHLRYVYIGEDEQGAALLAPLRSAAEPMIDLVRSHTLRGHRLGSSGPGRTTAGLGPRDAPP